MVYQDKFVVVVKCNGKVLRENDDIVTLPFGSEYSILLKNLSSRDAEVKVSVDGQDALYGSSLVVRANKQAELLGMLKGSTVRNRFKFIQKTEQIQDHRGDKIDDGMIRVEYAFEKRKPEVKSILHEKHEHHHHHHNDFFYHPPIIGNSGLDQHWNDNQTVYTSHTSGDGNIRATANLSRGVTEKGASNPVGETGGEVNVYHSNVVMDGLGDAPQVDEGITVAGSRINQDFTYATIGETDQSEVIILRLRGVKSSGEKVHAPILIKTKLTCPTCGCKSTSKAKFCANCGTNIEI